MVYMKHLIYYAYKNRFVNFDLKMQYKEIIIYF